MLDDTRRDEGLNHLRRGFYLERANRLDEAAAAYRQAISCHPHLREAHNALGFYFQRSGLIAKAADAFQTVARLEDNFMAHFNLGYVLVELERYEDALRSFQRCLELQPNDSATHLEIGFIHFSRGEFGEALSHLQHPLQSYPEDWEVHNLIGKCHLGLHHYDDATTAFGRALLLAVTTNSQGELLDNLMMVARHREFRHLNGAKDQFYAREGVVYLGSSQDDGIQISEQQNYHYIYPDIGTTVQRLIALVRSSAWNFQAIIAIDMLSQPLALAIGAMVQLPVRRVEEVSETDHVLLVMAVAREAELLSLALERIPGPLTTFSLILNPVRYSRQLPDLIGIVAQGAVSVPWESELRRLRSDGAPSEQIRACINRASEAISAAVRETPIDNNLPRQVRYYTRTHRRLNAPSS